MKKQHILYFAATLSFAALALYLTGDPRVPSRGLSVGKCDRSLGEVYVGDHLNILINIRNDSPETLFVVGFEEGCSTNCCLVWDYEGKVALPAHSDTEVLVKLTPTKVGDFSVDRDLYLADVGGTRSVKVSLRGHAIQRP